jgi:hypothetical protein
MGERQRPTVRSSRVLVTRAVLCLGLLVLPASFPLASAAFAGSTADSANSVSTATVAAPSSLVATQTCAAGPGISARASTVATGLSSLTLTPPAGTVAGDLLVAQVTNRNTAYTLTVPGGWTIVGTRTTAPGASSITSAVYWKWAAAGEGASTFTLGTADIQMVGGVVAYSGVHPSNPIDVSGIATGTSTVSTAPSVTTTAANAMLVHAFAKRQEAIPAATGTTQRWSLLSGTGAGNLGATAGDVLFAGPGATGTRSATASNAFEWVAHTLALRPAPGPPSASLTWTASPSSWATGYRLERSVGGTVQSTVTVTPIGTTSTTNGTLVNGTVYSYRLWAYYGTWVSTAVTAGLTPSC